MTAIAPIPDRIQDLDFNGSDSRDPISTDDTDAGYYQGSIWINTDTGNSFICTDATASAAVWLPLSTIGTVAYGMNVAGDDLVIAAGRSTGSGISGGVIFKYATQFGVSGSTPGTLATAFQILPGYLGGGTVFSTACQFLAAATFSSSVGFSGSVGATTFVEAGTYVKAGTFYKLPLPTELTISSYVVTATQSYHTIDTEGDAASGDLRSINGLSQSDVIFIRAVHTDRTVVLKHALGNIYTFSGSDISLDSTEKMVMGVMTSGNKLLIIGP